MLVSHTTHDLVFKWNKTDPLVVNQDIELPQLDIAQNTTEDCTLEYSTGKRAEDTFVVFMVFLGSADGNFPHFAAHFS